MTISSTDSRKSYAGNGVTTSFGTSPVVFFTSADLKVYVVVTATGAATLLTENTDYTVTGGSGSTGTIDTSTGSSPYGAPSALQTLLIVRDVAATQETDFVNNDSSDAEASERTLDKLTVLAQQLNTRLDRALALPESDVSDATVALPALADRASRFLACDADGNVTAIDGSDGTAGSLALALASTSSTTLGDYLVGVKRTNGIATTDHAFHENRELNAVTDLGCDKTGVVDNSTVIQAAIDALTAGGVIYFPCGAYNLGSTGLVNTNNGVVLKGETGRFVGSALFGVEFLYSGTGVAVAVGQSGSLNYRNGLDNIQIRATGSAASSATAIGLKLINTQYFSSDKSAIKDFASGVGLKFAAAGAAMYGASNVFKELFVHLCKIGVQSVGTSSVIKDNATLFIGGGLLQSAAPAGSIGFDIQQYSDSYVFYGVDVEGYETGWKIDGSNHLGLGARSEDCTTHVSFTTNATTSHFVRHANEGTGTAVTDTSTAHTSTFQTVGTAAFRGKWLIQPLSDTSEVFQLLNAAGTTYADWTTSGTPKMEWTSGPDHIGYSDAFTTRKWKITGSTGRIQSAQALLAYDQTAIPAGGTAGAGLLVSSTSNFGVFFGSGAPTLSAAKGSIYLRSDGSGTTDRMYVNTNGSTTWTAVTTVA